MAVNEIHVGDIGTQFVVEVKDGSTAVDVSSATTKQILIKKPDGTLLTKTAGFFTDGTDGKLTYSTISGDLSIAGTWKIQAYVIIGGSEWHSDMQSFKVHRNLT
jgi:hypothetical protein